MVNPRPESVTDAGTMGEVSCHSTRIKRQASFRETVEDEALAGGDTPPADNGTGLLLLTPPASGTSPVADEGSATTTAALTSESRDSRTSDARQDGLVGTMWYVGERYMHAFGANAHEGWKTWTWQEAEAASLEVKQGLKKQECDWLYLDVGRATAQSVAAARLARIQLRSGGLVTIFWFGKKCPDQLISLQLTECGDADAGGGLLTNKPAWFEQAVIDTGARHLQLKSAAKVTILEQVKAADREMPKDF